MQNIAETNLKPLPHHYCKKSAVNVFRREQEMISLNRTLSLAYFMRNYNVNSLQTNGCKFTNLGS